MPRRLIARLLWALALLGASVCTLSAEPLNRDEAIHLLKRTSFHFSQLELELLLKSGKDVYLQKQLAPAKTESVLEKYLRRMPRHGISPREIYLTLLAEPRATSIIEQEMQRSRLLRGLYSKQQLREVMTDFWFNHFNADPDKGTVVACNLPKLEEDLRQNAFANFEEILKLAVKNPAVLENLDNSVSKGEDVNENFGRELMELYTTGPVHTQLEVVEAARAFSGWSYNDNPNSEEYLQFRYFPNLQSPGGKVIFGRIFYDHEQELVLEHLANHSCTARFLSQKLVRRFVCDEPPQELVEKAAEVYLEHNGNMGAVVSFILSSPEFYRSKHRDAKLKSPQEFLVSVLAATRPLQAGPQLAENTDFAQFLTKELDKMGSPYSCPNPLGWPDLASTWLSGVGQRSRWQVAKELSAQSASELVSPEFQAR